ncbi:hypothetical protein [Demequina globuliformis]|uniref:hypothetical protein n=1 Tax=Demequina globuliformis TaxID=676202 RepID=UPI000782C6E7|nr:hypothetical protein [Demequina globuliformis]
MPGAYGELALPRWAWWAVMVVNVAITGFFVFGAFYPAGSAHWTAAFAALACGWLALTIHLYIQVIHRPRGRRDVMSIEPSRQAPALVLTASRRLTAWMTITASVWALALATFAVIADGGWGAFWAVCAGFAALGVASQALALKPRSVRLTSAGIEAVTNGASAAVAWDDIQVMTWQQVREGLMGIRVTPRSGAASWHAKPHRPWSRRDRRFLEIDLMPLDVDPLLVAHALFAYWKDPAARHELDSGTIPRRFTDPTTATVDSHGRHIVIPSHTYRFEAMDAREGTLPTA